MSVAFRTGIQPVSVARLNQSELWCDAQALAATQRLGIAQRYQDQFERLDIEFANLRISQSWLTSQQDDDAAAQLIRYVDALGSYLLQRGLGVVLVQWCTDSLRACEQLQRNPAQFLLLRSEACRALGRWDAVMIDVQVALATSTGVEPKTHRQALVALGRLQLNQGRYREALDTLTRIETLLDPQSDYEQLATVRSELAAYYLLQGALDQAIARYLDVEESYRQAGATEPTDRTLLMLGVLYRKKGDYMLAASYLLRLLNRAEKRHDQGALATAAHHLAWVNLNAGYVAQAHRLCGRSIALYEEIGDTRGLSDAQEQLGLINLAEDRVAEAIACLEQSLAIRRALGNQHGSASSLRRLAIVHWHARHRLLAIGYLSRSLITYMRLGVLNRQRVIATVRELRDWTIGYRRWTT